MTDRILVIDDDPMVRRALRRILESAGYQVALAEDGVDGLQMFHSLSPSLVICDIIMPEKEGMETIIDMRKSAKDCRIIAISGGGRIGNRDLLALAEKLGANATLGKPFDPTTLVDVVRRELAAQAAPEAVSAESATAAAPATTRPA